MISIYRKSDSFTNNEGRAKEVEIRGLSTDSKPTTLDGKDIANGTTFIEIDTGKVYLFDKENSQWKEI